jgi:D-alanyl-D-alanine carboxypeptidase/D-alanyl-D-alanine-endopeptidase (penicillin-binding protein 4)
LLLIGCASGKKAYLKNSVKNAADKNHFMGFMLFNPKTDKTLFEYNSHKYFTPASNTKIFTLYTGLELLPDNIASLNYVQENDTLFIKGTGDPTLLHPYFKNTTVIQFLTNHPSSIITIKNDNFYDDAYGPGWAWEDFGYYFMPERAAFPIYGNVVENYFVGDSLAVKPLLFKNNFTVTKKPFPREEKSNSFYIEATEKDTIETPFITSNTLLQNLLHDVTNKKITVSNSSTKKENWKTLYTLPKDSLLKRMMVVSDNFLAEQIHVMASATVTDSLSVKKSINYILENHLKEIPQSPRWVDGSGLSRYNLFTPNSMVYVLNQMYKTLPRERLFNLFPVGGVSGTLENWYGNTTPYVYAKSGTLGNNYCLSGYVITKKGKTLIFSFMANHFKQSTNSIRRELQALLAHVREKY